MTKEILLYSGIYPFVAADIITAMEEASDVDVVLRVNSPGGDVFAGWGIVAKMKERTMPCMIKADGFVASMAANLCLYASNVECLDVTKFLFHRADGRVDNPEDQEFLDSVNADLKKQMKLKIDSSVFKEVTGYSIEDIFNPEQRIDVVLSAAQAKKVGLVKKINKLSSVELKAHNEKYYSLAALSSMSAKVTPENKPSNTKKMTVAELKASHPDVYASIFNEGVAQEKDRVGAYMAFLAVAPKEVAEGIKGDKPLSMTLMAEFSMKAVSGKVLAAAAVDGGAAPVAVTGAAPVVAPGEPVVTGPEAEKKANVDAFEASVRASLGLK